MNTQTIKNAFVKAYQKSDAHDKTFLESLFGKPFFSTDPMEWIKTFDDACEAIGENPTDEKFSTGTTDEIAYKKLKVICAALNNGVELSFENSSQKKWYPWFEYVAGSGFRFGDSFYVYTHTGTAGGSRLCYHSEQLAKYAGTQFIELYNQLLK